MRRFGILLLLASCACSCLAAKRVTVEQLQQLLVEVHGKPDAKVAELLSEVELTERLNAAGFSRLSSDLPGPESRQHLTLVADLSAFLPLPAAETPATPPPSVAEQRQMLTLAISYTEKTITKLPNFFATRNMVRFENTLPGYRPGGAIIAYQPLHGVGKSSDTLVYRDGQEVVDTGEAKGKNATATQGLHSWGVFGPILSTLLVDAAHGSLGWSHWEEGKAGREAVFHYSVPKEKSQYRVTFCCVPGTDNGVYSEPSAYHGVIAIDPASGAILRLTMQADLKPTDPVLRSDLMVEYAPVDIGGTSYICPTKSISVLISPPLDSKGMVMMRGPAQQAASEIQLSSEHIRIWLNEVVFGQYRVSRTDAHAVIRKDLVEAENSPPEEAESASMLEWR